MAITFPRALHRRRVPKGPSRHVCAQTQPIDPLMPLFFNNRNTFLDRFWLPQSACRIAPSGTRIMTLRAAATTRDAFIRKSMK